MRIPQRFKLFGQTIEVVDDTTLAADNQMGFADYHRGLVLLLPISESFRASEITREQTFCHELVHHLFRSAGVPDKLHCERTVEILGCLLHQALTTMEYE